MNQIPLFKVLMSPEAPEKVGKVLMSGYVGQGKAVDEFEYELDQVIGFRPLTVNSCTSALTLALHLAGVRAGSIVVSTPMTCTATNTAIVDRQAKICWADVDRYTGLVTKEYLRDALISLDFEDLVPAAIMITDWAGHPSAVDELREVANEIFPFAETPIIQDAAHSFAATRTEGVGDYICYSFQAIKHLTTGDGGALCVPSKEYERAKLLRWFGLDRTKGESFRCSQQIYEAGFKFHMNDITATIGLANLPLAKKAVSKHWANASYLSSFGIGAGAYMNSSYWMYPVLVNNRDAFTTFMSERGVTTSPAHTANCFQPCFDDHIVCRRDLPGVTYFNHHQTNLPCGWWLTPEDRTQIAEALSDWTTSRHK